MAATPTASCPPEGFDTVEDGDSGKTWGCFFGMGRDGVDQLLGMGMLWLGRFCISFSSQICVSTAFVARFFCV